MTASTRVRPWRTEDADALAAAVRASLPELMRWLPWCHRDYDRRDAEQWIVLSLRAWAARSEFPLGVFDADGTVIGGVGINRIDWTTRSGNLGYWIATPHSRHGHARSAARQAAELGFHTLGLQRLEIRTAPDNHPSQRVAQALGARRQTPNPQRPRPRGEPGDTVIFVLTVADLGGGGVEGGSAG